jgi:hypothetical protein
VAGAREGVAEEDEIGDEKPEALLERLDLRIPLPDRACCKTLNQKQAWLLPLLLLTTTTTTTTIIIIIVRMALVAPASYGGFLVHLKDPLFQPIAGENRLQAPVKVLGKAEAEASGRHSSVEEQRTLLSLTLFYTIFLLLCFLFCS